MILLANKVDARIQRVLKRWWQSATLVESVLALRAFNLVKPPCVGGAITQPIPDEILQNTNPPGLGGWYRFKVWNLSHVASFCAAAGALPYDAFSAPPSALARNAVLKRPGKGESSHMKEDDRTRARQSLDGLDCPDHWRELSECELWEGLLGRGTCPACETEFQAMAKLDGYPCHGCGQKLIPASYDGGFHSIGEIVPEINPTRVHGVFTNLWIRADHVLCHCGHAYPRRLSTCPQLVRLAFKIFRFGPDEEPAPLSVGTCRIAARRYLERHAQSGYTQHASDALQLIMPPKEYHALVTLLGSSDET